MQNNLIFIILFPFYEKLICNLTIKKHVHFITYSYKIIIHLLHLHERERERDNYFKYLQNTYC